MSYVARFLRHGLPVVGLAAVGVWFLWGMAPPSVIPPAPATVEVFLPPAILLTLFLGTLAGLVLGRGRDTLPWVTLAVLSVPLAVNLLFVSTWLTFPADF